MIFPAALWSEGNERGTRTVLLTVAKPSAHAHDVCDAVSLLQRTFYKTIHATVATAARVTSSIREFTFKSILFGMSATSTQATPQYTPNCRGTRAHPPRYIAKWIFSSSLTGRMVRSAHWRGWWRPDFASELHSLNPPTEIS